jgi:formamidopyrimidine-DNA glycosylase
MPELPEVETVRQGLMPHLLHQRVLAVTLRQEQLRWPVPRSIIQSLPDETLVAIDRRGKYLLFQTEKGTLIAHLGMSGQLRIVTKEVKPEKHDHLDIIFYNDKVLRFTDPRRFGSILWTEDCPHQHPLLIKIGPEPLTDEFDAEYLQQASSRRYTAVKAFIMNSEIVAGIGNIYANESLFHAGIDPQTSCHTLSLEQCKKLVVAIKDVLVHAIKQGGTTLKDFTSAEGKPGYFAQKLYVYGRANQPCLVCQSVLRQFQLNRRSTVYCPTCQV